MKKLIKSKSLQSLLNYYFLISLLLVILSFSILSLSLVSILFKSEILTTENGININIDSESARNLISMAGSLYLFIQLVIVFVSIRKFSRIVSKRVTTPVNMVTKGLKEITTGKLDTRLHFKTENEFVDIRDNFNYMAQKIEDAEKEKERYEKERIQLFANITHDLKTPITSITGYSQALSSGLILDAGQMDKFHHAIYFKSKQINDLLNLMFEYTKLDSNLTIHEEGKLNISELLREVVAYNYTDIEEAGMNIELDIPNEELNYFANKLELFRAFSNLITNALRHNLKGTSILARIVYSEKMEIIFADTGEFISEELSSSLFKPFVLGDESRTKGGSGLGLAIVEKLIRRNRGSIVLETNYPGFTKAFIITLPKYDIRNDR